jgi:hypothetical protein
MSSIEKDLVMNEDLKQLDKNLRKEITFVTKQTVNNLHTSMANQLEQQEIDLSRLKKF